MRSLGGIYAEEVPANDCGVRDVAEGQKCAHGRHALRTSVERKNRAPVLHEGREVARFAAGGGAGVDDDRVEPAV